MKVLFVCVENAGRSQMAEAFARTMGLEAYSCGSQPAERVNPVAVEAMREKGIDLSPAAPKGFGAVPRADVVVTMGCGDACPVVAGRRFDWDLPDPRGMDLGGVRRVRDEIERRVRELSSILSVKEPEMERTPREAIQELLQQLNQAWVKGRPEGLEDLFHPDVVFVQPGLSGRVVGRRDCIESYRDFTSRAMIRDLKLGDPTIDVFGDTAVASYSFEIDYEMGGARHRETGSDLFVLTRQEGRWVAVWRTLVSPAPPA